jgi:hypothetical protein
MANNDSAFAPVWVIAFRQPEQMLTEDTKVEDIFLSLARIPSSLD